MPEPAQPALPPVRGALERARGLIPIDTEEETVGPPQPGVDTARWDRAFARPASPTLDAVMRRTLTSAYPAEVEAVTIWPTWDLGVLAKHLRLRPGATFVDLACGAGQQGMWIARETGAKVVGVDPSAVGRERATAHAARAGIDATYLDGHFLQIPLPDALADALLCIDGIHFATDHAGTAREMRRVLRIGGRCVVVAAEPVAPDAPRWSAALEPAGFTIVSREETPDWRQRFLDGWRQIVASEAEIRAELGAEAEDVLGRAAQVEEIAGSVRHVLVVAEATAS